MRIDAGLGAVQAMHNRMFGLLKRYLDPKVTPSSESIRTILDLGCGVGQSTFALCAEFPNAKVRTPQG